jgi:hypothetical protein
MPFEPIPSHGPTLGRRFVRVIAHTLVVSGPWIVAHNR